MGSRNHKGKEDNMNCKEFLEGKELTDLKPRLRCVSCRRTVAEIYDNGKGNYLIIPDKA
jgi:hypothetical protein